MSVKVIYKDIVPSGKDDISNIEVSEINSNIANTELLKVENNQSVHYATLEKNQWKLDGTYKALTSNNIGYWSTQISNDETTEKTVGDITYNLYMFGTPITITRVFKNKHTSVGLSFTFADPDYCNYLNVKWYNDDVEVYNVDFYPNSSQYYCKQNVEVFNKVEVTFYSMNKANRFLKIFAIDDGVNRTFNDSDIYSITILSEMSLISDELFNHTLDLSLKRTEDTEFIFQKRQPVLVYKDNELDGQFFVESSERTSENVYDIQCHNYTGILESNKFYGGIYFNVLAKDIINEIFTGENIKVNIDTETANTLLSGYIPITTKREALSQVLFACCSVCDTMRTTEFNIFKLADTTTEISADRIFMGGSVKTTDKVTSVVITAHSYTVANESSEVYKGNVFTGLNTIEFSNPVDTPTVSVSGATLVNCYNNYCIINATSDLEITITGKIYNDNTSTKQMIDDNVILGTTSNELSITDATLVSSLNVDKVLLNVFNHALLNSTLECDMVFEDEKIGDNVVLHTEWSGDKTGRIEQMEYDIRSKKIGKVVQRISG